MMPDEQQGIEVQYAIRRKGGNDDHDGSGSHASDDALKINESKTFCSN